MPYIQLTPEESQVELESIKRTAARLMEEHRADPEKARQFLSCIGYYTMMGKPDPTRKKAGTRKDRPTLHRTSSDPDLA